MYVTTTNIFASALAFSWRYRGVGGLTGCLDIVDGSPTDDGADQLPSENLTDAFDIQHSTGSQSSSRSSGSDRDTTSTEKINFTPTELYLFGSEVDRHVVIEQVESGLDVRLSPTDEAETYLVNRVRPEIRGATDLRKELTVFTPEREEVAEQIPVSAEGDTDMFQQELFATYRVRLLEAPPRWRRPETRL